ncbi:MAG: Methionine aminotransferase [Bacteroidota bacterium]|jgi:methionine aminotransferase
MSASKLPHVGTTIFTTMSALAQKHGAINLAQGFPNFPIDPQLQAQLIRVSQENAHQYAPLQGLVTLREKVANLIDRQYKREVDTDEILITAGATQAIFTIIQALVFAGEEVIILDPSYDCYEAPVHLVGAKAIRLPLTATFDPDWDLIEAHLNERTKLLIINNPHNPSGKIWRESDFLALESLMQRFPNLLLLSDEVYEFITFEQQHQSIHERCAIRERSIVVSSFGKTFHITGWKVGYLVCPKALMTEILKVHQFLVFCVNSVAQHALAAYLDLVDVNTLSAFYQQKRDIFRAGLKKSRFTLLPAEGSYFQVADFSAISKQSDVEFSQELTVKFGVAAIPISVFNANGHDANLIRFCYAKTDETLQEAIEKLCKI